MGKFWTCPCGAVNLTARTACEICAKPRGQAPSQVLAPIATHQRECGHCRKDRVAERVAEPSTYPCPTCGAVSVWFCHGCGDRGVGVPTIAASDGRRLCSSCRMAMVQPSRDDARCTEPGCGQTAAQHRGEFHAILATWAAKARQHRQMLTRRVPSGELDRPAAAWSDEERTQRAMDALTAYREHLRRQSDAEVPF